MARTVKPNEYGVITSCPKDVKEAVIPAGVTAIGERAFSGCAALSSVEIPSSVTAIGDFAFKGCNITELSHPCLTIKGGVAIKDGKVQYCASQAREIVIPAGVTEIGCGAFMDCTALASVVIPAGVTEIGWAAFSGCTALASVVIPESVTEIGERAFKGCNITELSHPCLTIKGGVAIKDGKVQYCASQAREIVIPAGVTEIGCGAFNDCAALASVEIPAGVTEIGESAFSGCKALASVVIPASVTKIGKYAFEDCAALASVVIPDSVTGIGVRAFRGCAALASVEIPAGVTAIGGMTFYGCTSLASVVIGSGVTAIGYEVFKGCTALKTVTLADNLAKVNADWFKDLPEDYEIVCTEGSAAYKAVKRSSRLKAHVKALVLETAKTEKIRQIQQVGADAFIGSLLKGKPDSSFEILASTKAGTVVLVQIAENNAVFKLGADSSKWTDKAKKAAEILSDSAKSGREIYDALLKNKLPLAEIPAKKAKNLTLKAGADKTVRLFCKGKVEAYGNGWTWHSIFPKDVRSAELFGVTAIVWRAFEGCKSLASVVIPDSVTEIGKGAFSGCAALSSVVIPDSVTEIGNVAFEDCTALASVVIPAGVTEIDDWAFSGCSSLASVAFGGTMAQWDAVWGKVNLFNGDVPATGVKCADGVWQKPVVLVKDGVAVKCLDKSAASVEIPAGVTEIGVWAFDGCKALVSVVIPESVTKIGKYAFEDCAALASVVIPDSVTKISKYAFEDCAALASVVIPDSVTEIGENAFEGCKALAAVEFGGTMAQWDAVKGKDNLFNGDVPATGVKCADGEWQKPVVLVEDGVAVECLDKSAASVEIPAGVTEIGKHAFRDCTSLSSVVIPESVTKIGVWAFYGCTALASVVIPESVTEIGGSAFRDCTALASVVIPESVTKIYAFAFKECTSLASVVISAGVTEIGWQAFSGCTELSSVEFGGTVAQWEAVEKGDGWHEDVPAKSVKCADGEARL